MTTPSTPDPQRDSKFTERIGIALVGAGLASMFVGVIIFGVQRTPIGEVPSISQALTDALKGGSGCAAATGTFIYLGANRLSGDHAWNRWRVGLLVGLLTGCVSGFLANVVILDPTLEWRGRLRFLRSEEARINEAKAVIAAFGSAISCGWITASSLIVFGRRQN